MITIEQLIGDLLVRHNCVIVPNFGGFVAQKVSARIDFDKGTMIPPRKSLMFNKQLVNNDGLLISEFAQKNAASYNEANTQVTETAFAWKQLLKEGKQIEIDRVGRLFLDDENNIQFEQDRFFNLLLESFGLGQVHFISEEVVEEKQPEIVVEVAKEEVKIVPLPAAKVSAEEKEKETKEVQFLPVEEKQSKKRVWKYVAAACVLPIAFYSVWIPVKTDVLESGVISIKDFNPFHSNQEGVYNQSEFTEEVAFSALEIQSLEDQVTDLEQSVEVFPYDFGDNTFIQIRLDKEEATPVEPINESIPVSENIDAELMHVIVGCFGNEDNATNLVDKLREAGLDGKIVDVKGGLHRVSAGGAVSMESVNDIRQKASSLGFQGWILK